MTAAPTWYRHPDEGQEPAARPRKRRAAGRGHDDLMHRYAAARDAGSNPAQAAAAVYIAESTRRRYEREYQQARNPAPPQPPPPDSHAALRAAVTAAMERHLPAGAARTISGARCTEEIMAAASAYAARQVEKHARPPLPVPRTGGQASRKAAS